jgi:two-component system, cell cycle sensor histidine kinase and response regulator CckA
MSDPSGREKELLEEVSALRKKIQETERSEAERKQMEKELSVSRDRLSRAEIISRCGNWEFDLKSKRVFASEGAHRIYGMPQQEWTIPEVQTIPLPEYRDMLNEALRGLIDENIPYNVEFKIRRPDTGEIIDVHSVAEYDRDRNVIFGIIQDVTDRKRIEEALRDAQGRYRLLFQYAPYGIVIVDPATLRFVDFNETAHQQLGYSWEEFADLTISDLEVVESAEDVRTHTENIIRKGRDDFESKHRTKHGEIRNIHVTAQMTRISGHELYHCVWRDITDQKRAEDGLKERERTLQAFFDAVHEGMLLTDREGTLILVNAVSAQRMGKTVAELVGTHLYDHLPPDVARFRKGQHGKVIATGEPIYFQDTRAGRYYEHYYYPVFDEKKKVSAIAIFARDITERKRWLEALAESEERYRTVVEHSRDGIAIIGEGVHIYVNQRFLDMFGFHSTEEVLGKSHSVTVHPDDLERVVGINSARQEGDNVPSTYEFKGIRKDGSTIFIDVSATRIMYKGNYDSLVFLRDITDRKRAEEALLQSEQTLQEERDKLRTISENAPFGIALIDKDGLFTYVNPKFRELFGFDLSDTPDGRAWLRKAYPKDEYRHMVASAWTEDLGDARPGEQKPRVFNVTCKDGTQKIVSFITSVLTSGDCLMACEDITDLKHLESQLRQAQKMEAVGTLAGGIAHDFNNILTTIIGYSSLLQMNMDRSNPLKLYVDPILSATQKAADLTQSLLAFSRQQPVTLTPLDINKTIKETKKLLNRLLTEDIALHTSFTADDTIVMADKTQMDQILFNLVTNARDAMPKGGALTIETDTVEIGAEFIRTHGFGEPGRHVLIKISDTGTGMDEATLENIFEPFFTTKEVGKGTGLGLATVYGIVKQHGGYITVDSAPDQGSAFRIYLPAVKATVDQEEEKAVSVKRGSETVLIAEDNEGVRRFMRDALEKYGYKTIEATDGEDAIEKFTQHRDIDLVILDSVMPKKNGREVYEAIRRIRPSIKALFTSGYTKDIVLDKGIEDKDLDFIAKPLSPTALLQKIREVLDR